MSGRRLAAVVALAGSIACAQDPLALSRREIAAGYILERIEANYFLIDDTHPGTVGGVIAGVVIAIGWDDQVIVVERHALFSSDPDAIMVVDLNSRTVNGPLTREQVDADPDLADIERLDPAKAWESLRR